MPDTTKRVIPMKRKQRDTTIALGRLEGTSPAALKKVECFLCDAKHKLADVAKVEDRQEMTDTLLPLCPACRAADDTEVQTKVLRKYLTPEQWAAMADKQNTTEH
jgi:hypothetical protein